MDRRLLGLVIVALLAAAWTGYRYVVLLMTPPEVRSGMHVIPVYNYIENIEDFPDYRFISASRDWFINKTSVTGFVAEDGMIPTVDGEFCFDFVYAVPKAAIGMSDELVCAMSGGVFSAFLESSGAKQVASGMDRFEFVFNLSTEISVTEYYHIALGQNAWRPTRTVVTHGLRDIHIALIMLSVVGLAGIIAILARRKRK